MSEEDFGKLVRIIQSNLFEGLRDLEITPEHDLKSDLLIDSLIFYALLIDLEKSFKISFNITSRNAKEFCTVGSISTYIDLLRRKANEK